MAREASQPDPYYIDPTKSTFPMENYPQSVDKWVLTDVDKDAPIVDMATQERYFAALKAHYYGMDLEGSSPWNPFYIRKILSSSVENTRDWGIDAYLGTTKNTWGQNFRTHDEAWKSALRDNAEVRIGSTYDAANRGIVTRESLVRVLPTDDPAYNDPRKAGEGYPFDNFQMSSIRPGTPIYTLAVSQDHRWRYVISPEVTGWVHYEDIADASAAFVNTWLKMADAHLGAFTSQPVSIYKKHAFRFTARIGTVLPFMNANSSGILVAIPVSNMSGEAQMEWYEDTDQTFSSMPIPMNRRNLAKLMQSLVNRPYGWGNYNFYNDCSAELRSLLLPFGIFMPRNSLAQIDATSRKIDLAKSDVDARIDYLVKNGKPFTTLIHIPGHIMMYIGNKVFNGKLVPMTYQDVWGLRPKDADGRSIIGGSVFLPLLKSYPEDANLQSLAGKSKFEVGFIE